MPGKWKKKVTLPIKVRKRERINASLEVNESKGKGIRVNLWRWILKLSSKTHLSFKIHRILSTGFISWSLPTKLLKDSQKKEHWNEDGSGHKPKRQSIDWVIKMLPMLFQWFHHWRWHHAPSGFSTHNNYYSHHGILQHHLLLLPQPFSLPIQDTHINPVICSICFPYDKTTHFHYGILQLESESQRDGLSRPLVARRVAMSFIGVK